MVVESLKRWLPEALENEVRDLCVQLQNSHGHRTVWLDGENCMWHAEPDELLEELGHRYVGTFLRPAREDVCDALANLLPVRPAVRMRPSSLPAPAFARVGALAPA
ncbi:MAG: hypothetical protein KUG77_02115 [Nannocystaceae bacterium]|nr:hypothetical protein [Nannocystaceae bacterium]